MGDTNGGEWHLNLEILLENSKIIDLSKKDIDLIESTLDGCIENSEHLGAGSFVRYPQLKVVQNSRFDYCWFLTRSNNPGWDMCVQSFDDEWYIINIGDGRGRHSYWYKCDTIEGVINLIKDKFIS